MYLSPPSQEAKLSRSNSEPDFQNTRTCGNNALQCSRPRGGSRISTMSKESRERYGSKDSHDNYSTVSVCTPEGSFNSDDLSVRACDGSLNSSIDESPLKVYSPSQAEVKAQAYERLTEELSKAKDDLKLKDEQCEKLMRIRNELESELEDLTASLFQEAHAMVHDAKLKESLAEKRFVEANNKVEILQAEVTALKTLVITSTPSKPGIIRSQSTDHVNYCPECGSKHCQSLLESEDTHKKTESWEAKSLDVANIDEKEVDVILFKEFLDWMDERAVSHDQPFLARIYAEDVAPCLNFYNKELSIDVLGAIENHTILMESLGPKGIRRKCSLTGTSRICKHHMKLTDQGDWHYICQSARNRIAAVCDFYTYVGYIHQRLVKADVTVIYWQIMKRRAEMALTRLGFSSKND